MARPVKAGLDYFPFDVDFAVNPKTEAIMGEFGSKGVLLMIYLLSAVYRKGYYLVWDKLEQMQLVNRVQGSSPEMANQIVDRLVAYGTFDKELFNSAKVLTSLRIQETYFDAIKRRKSPKPTKYLVNVNINSGSSKVNDDINTQSKVKESKEKNIDIDAREEFIDFWRVYPKHQKSEPAFQAYYQARLLGVTKDQLITGAKNYAADIKAKNKGLGYVAMPDKWLLDHRWNDTYDYKPDQPKQNSKTRFASTTGNDSFTDDQIPF